MADGISPARVSIPVPGPATTPASARSSLIAAADATTWAKRDGS